MPSPLSPAALASLALLVANTHSSRAGPMLDHPAIVNALARAASRELNGSVQLVEHALKFFCEVRGELYERIRRGIAGALKASATGPQLCRYLEGN